MNCHPDFLPWKKGRTFGGGGVSIEMQCFQGVLFALSTPLNVLLYFSALIDEQEFIRTGFFLNEPERVSHGRCQTATLC